MFVDNNSILLSNLLYLFFFFQVGREGEIEPLPVKPIMFNEYDIVHQRILENHRPESLVKAVDTLSFLVRENHITAASLPAIVQACRTFVEATLHGGNYSYDFVLYSCYSYFCLIFIDL